MYGISISPSEGWWANARWRTLEEATAGFPKHFNGYLSDGSFFCPAEMGPEASRPKLCVLELWGVQNKDENDKLALHLTFDEAHKTDSLRVFLLKYRQLTELEVRASKKKEMEITLPYDIENGHLFFHQSN